MTNSYGRPKSRYLLASDKLNVGDLHPFTGYPRYHEPLVEVIDLNPDEVDDHIILYMPISETNGPISGKWIYQTGAGTVESGTFAGPVR